MAKDLRTYLKKVREMGPEYYVPLRLADRAVDARCGLVTGHHRPERHVAPRPQIQIKGFFVEG